MRLPGNKKLQLAGDMKTVAVVVAAAAAAADDDNDDFIAHFVRNEQARSAQS